MRRHILTFSLLLLLGLPALHADVQRVVVRCDEGCGRLAPAIAALGGQVTHRYRDIDALAATVPRARRAELLEHPDARAVYDDAEMAPPEPEASVDLELTRSEPDQGAALDALLEESPGDPIYNTALTGARELHRRGHTGEGVVVAVIDSGVVNRPGHVLYGKVLGGETLAAGERSATSRFNHAHGTASACMIAAQGVFYLPAAHPASQAIAAYAPDSIFPCDGVSCPLGINRVPVLGTAPGAGLYALKVDAADGTSALSNILAAMERAITLRRNYDAGVPAVPVAGDGSEDDPYVYDALNVRVVSLGNGWETYFAGHGPQETMIRALYDADILPVVGAGNDGPAALTVNDMGSAHGALTVGAAATVTHARIFYDIAYGPGSGLVVRPSDHHQMSFTSARGPLADGRLGLDLVASGHRLLVQRPDLEPTLESGTSLSGPTVAGAAALLFGAAPWASAAEVRAALIAAADPEVLGDGSAPIDQGHGFVNIPAALARLEAGGLDTTLPRGAESATVAGNIAALGFETIRLGAHGARSAWVADLRPGQAAHFFVESGKKTDLLRVRLRNVTPELPPGQQNAVFGDGIDLVVVDAVTSLADTVAEKILVTDEATDEVAHPQTGLVRIAVVGHSDNAGRVSGELVIEAVDRPQAPKLAAGQVKPGEIEVLTVAVPPDTGQAVFELSWTHHWGAFPTDSLALELTDPAGNRLPWGFTIRSPVRVVIDDPLPGVWRTGVWGHRVHGIRGGDASHWALRVTDQDGAPLGGPG